jgi:predicted methyltransferase
MSSLTRIVPWSQKLASEVLRPSDLAVDLTAGKGRDTLALAKAVGSQGQVVAFDLQAVALEQTAELLRQHDFAVHLWSSDQVVPKQPGVFLVQACHSRLDQLLRHPARVIVANLGYLPGGDNSLITHPDSTLAALQQSLALLLSGGRLAVTVYPAHPGGGEEGALVNDFFCALPLFQWQALSLTVANCAKAPSLLVAERISNT